MHWVAKTLQWPHPSCQLPCHDCSASWTTSVEADPRASRRSAASRSSIVAKTPRHQVSQLAKVSWTHAHPHCAARTEADCARTHQIHLHLIQPQKLGCSCKSSAYRSHSAPTNRFVQSWHRLNWAAHTAPAARLAATVLVRLCAKVGTGAGPSDGADVLISDDGWGTQTPDGVAVSLGSFLMAA